MSLSSYVIVNIFWFLLFISLWPNSVCKAYLDWLKKFILQHNSDLPTSHFDVRAKRIYQPDFISKSYKNEHTFL